MKRQILEAVAQSCSVKKLFIEISHHRKTPVPESLFKESCRGLQLDQKRGSGTGLFP